MEDPDVLNCQGDGWSSDRRNWGSFLFSAMRRWRGCYYIAVCGYMLEGGHREGKRCRNKLPHTASLNFPRGAFVSWWLLLQQIFDTMGSRTEVLLHRDKAKEMDTQFFFLHHYNCLMFILILRHHSSFLLSTLTYPFLERELIPICIQGDSLLTRLQCFQGSFWVCAVLQLGLASDRHPYGRNLYCLRGLNTEVL